MTKVFVYGTLKQKHCRGHVLSKQTFLGEVQTVPQYRMYSVGYFPCLQSDDSGISIKGELYEVDDKCLEHLDLIEGVPHLFQRGEVQIEGHEDEDVIAYFWAGEVDNLSLLDDSWEGD